MFTNSQQQNGLTLSPRERLFVEATIHAAEQQSRIRAVIAPGHYHEELFYPCTPLTEREYNVDVQGNLTLCCQLSGFEGSASNADVIGSLHTLSLCEALERFRNRVQDYWTDKQAKWARHEATPWTISLASTA
jgi:hypothetical protein